MGPFYAYLQDEQNDHYRYLITFANRETADEWWRMVSTPPSPYATTVGRVDPQFYTQKETGFSNLSITAFFSHAALPNAKQFHRKMFMTPLYKSADRISITLPLLTITDHISGKWYFIRSKTEPSNHWYLRIKGTCLVCGNASCDAVHVSSQYRTKFCIRLRDQGNVSKELVMIGRDKISIAAPGEYTVHINAARDLKATKAFQGQAPHLHFDDLKDRFVTRAEKQVNDEIWEYVELVMKGLGEAWELVE